MVTMTSRASFQNSRMRPIKPFHSIWVKDGNSDWKIHIEYLKKNNHSNKFLPNCRRRLRPVTLSHILIWWRKKNQNNHFFFSADNNIALLPCWNFISLCIEYINKNNYCLTAYVTCYGAILSEMMFSHCRIWQRMRKCVCSRASSVNICE